MSLRAWALQYHVFWWVGVVEDVVGYFFSRIKHWLSQSNKHMPICRWCKQFHLFFSFVIISLKFSLGGLDLEFIPRFLTKNDRTLYCHASGTICSLLVSFGCHWGPFKSHMGELGRHQRLFLSYLGTFESCLWPFGSLLRPFQSNGTIWKFSVLEQFGSYLWSFGSHLVLIVRHLVAFDHVRDIWDHLAVILEYLWVIWDYLGFLWDHFCLSETIWELSGDILDSLVPFVSCLGTFGSHIGIFGIYPRLFERYLVQFFTYFVSFGSHLPRHFGTIWVLFYDYGPFGSHPGTFMNHLDISKVTPFKKRVSHCEQ